MQRQAIILGMTGDMIIYLFYFIEMGGQAGKNTFQPCNGCVQYHDDTGLHKIISWENEIWAGSPKSKSILPNPDNLDEFVDANELPQHPILYAGLQSANPFKVMMMYAMKQGMANRSYTIEELKPDEALAITTDEYAPKKYDPQKISSLPPSNTNLRYDFGGLAQEELYQRFTTRYCRTMDRAARLALCYNLESRAHNLLIHQSFASSIPAKSL